MQIILTYPSLPPSVNHYLNKAGSRVYRSKATVSFRDEMIRQMKASRVISLFKPTEHLKAKCVIYTPPTMLYTLDSVLKYQKGKIDTPELKRWDLSNHYKVLEDVVCEYFGIDDKVFIEVILQKKHHLENTCKFVIDINLSD